MGNEKMESMYEKMESMYGKIRVRIKGISPLLMNRLTVEKLKRDPKNKRLGETYDDDEEAREAAYITVVDGEEQLYIPARAVFKCILNGAKGYRVFGGALGTYLAGTITIEPEKILLGHCNYEVDVQIVRVITARVPRARAKVSDWEAEFFIIYDRAGLTILIEKGKLKETVEVSGRKAGLLDWRPEKKGPFGKFIVEDFSIIS